MHDQVNVAAVLSVVLIGFAVAVGADGVSDVSDLLLLVFFILFKLLLHGCVFILRNQKGEILVVLILAELPAQPFFNGGAVGSFFQR